MPEKNLQLHNKSVAILLGTYNGQKYLQKQLDSIARQSFVNWKIYISDDGSTDNTTNILKQFQSKIGASRVFVQNGPSKGFAINFLSLACQKNIMADFYAYSDQDDIWQEDKLEKALLCLSDIAEDKPALYCSRSQLIDENDQIIGYSPLFKIKPKFAHAIVQNIAGGNTMVFNNAARNLIYEFGVDINVIAHDWWSYLLICACDGYVFYDVEPNLLYRQHRDNLIGSNLGWKARFSRLNRLLCGEYKLWNTNNIQALEKHIDLLTIENQKTLKIFLNAKNSWLLPRLFYFFRSGVYRHNKISQLALIFAAVFNKI